MFSSLEISWILRALVAVEIFVCWLFPVLDNYCKVKNRDLVELRGIKRILFIRSNLYTPNRKNYISKTSFIVQIIHRIYIIFSLSIVVIFKLLLPNETLILIGSIFLLIIYGLIALIASLIIRFLTLYELDKLEKNKEVAEKNQSNSSTADSN